MTDEELSELIAFATITWPNQPDLPQTQRIIGWRPYLADLPQTVAHAAIVQLGCEGDRFAAPPGLIRKRSIALMHPDRFTSPEQGWQMIRQRIAATGWTSALDSCSDCVRLDVDGRAACEHHWVTFDDPAVQAFVDAVGWKYLCESTNEMADRAHFMRWYPVAVDRLANLAALPQSVRELQIEVAATLQIGSGE